MHILDIFSWSKYVYYITYHNHNSNPSSKSYPNPIQILSSHFKWEFARKEPSLRSPRLMTLMTQSVSLQVPQLASTLDHPTPPNLPDLESESQSRCTAVMLHLTYHDYRFEPSPIARLTLRSFLIRWAKETVLPVRIIQLSKFGGLASTVSNKGSQASRSVDR